LRRCGFYPKRHFWAVFIFSKPMPLGRGRVKKEDKKIKDLFLAAFPTLPTCINPYFRFTFVWAANSQPCLSMTQSSIAPPESLRAALIQAAEAFIRLPASDEVFDAYLSIQESMVDVLQSTPDPNPYGTSWSLIALQESVELLRAQQGNQEALLRLKQQVSQSIACLP
jgi:hypothetical protein